MIILLLSNVTFCQKPRRWSKQIEMGIGIAKIQAYSVINGKQNMTSQNSKYCFYQMSRSKYYFYQMRLMSKRRQWSWPWLCHCANHKIGRQLFHTTDRQLVQF